MPFFVSSLFSVHVFTVVAAYVMLDCSGQTDYTCQSYQVFLNDQPLLANVPLTVDDPVGVYYKWIHR